MELLSSAFTVPFCTKKNIRGDTLGWWKVLLLGTYRVGLNPKDCIFAVFFLCVCLCGCAIYC